MPLDLKDEYLFVDNATLFARVQDTLDDQGWNIAGGIYSSTYLRAGAAFARVRECITEVALDNASTVSISDIL